MRIRTATQDDLDAICRVEAICFPASEAGTHESFAARLKVFPRHFLLLEDEGRLIGFVNGMVTDDRTISDVRAGRTPQGRREMAERVRAGRIAGTQAQRVCRAAHAGAHRTFPRRRALRLHPDVQGASPAVLYPIRFQESGRFPVATWRGRLV